MNLAVDGAGGPIVGIGDLAADIVVEIPEFPFEAGQVHITSTLRVEPGARAIS